MRKNFTYDTNSNYVATKSAIKSNRFRIIIIETIILDDAISITLMYNESQDSEMHREAAFFKISLAGEWAS